MPYTESTLADSSPVTSPPLSRLNTHEGGRHLPELLSASANEEAKRQAHVQEQRTKEEDKARRAERLKLREQRKKDDFKAEQPDQSKQSEIKAEHPDQSKQSEAKAQQRDQPKQNEAEARKLEQEQRRNDEAKTRQVGQPKRDQAKAVQPEQRKPDEKIGMEVSHWPKLKGWIRFTCYRIFFLAPIKMGRKQGLQYPHLYKFYWYASIVAMINWGVPLILFLIWYVIMVQGCVSITARGLLEGICVGPYLSPTNQIPWHLHLWKPQEIPVNHPQIQSTLYIESMMTGHTRLYDTAWALVHQVSKTEEDAPGFVSEEMSSDLRRVAATATELYPYFENFSRTFSLEKDIMNHHFRAFVNAYGRAISRSDLMELSISSIVIWPMWEHFLRFINQYALIPWLPDPKLYSLQVRSEIRFQAKRFTEESLAALGRIDASYSAMQQLHDSGSLIQRLWAATDTINLHQHKLNQTIADFKKNDSFLQHYLSHLLTKPKPIQALEIHYLRSERVRQRINALMSIVPIYENDSARLKTELHYLRTTFNYAPTFDISPQGLIAVSATLQAHIRLPTFSSWLKKQSGGFDNNTTTTSNIYRYNLDEVGNFDISSLRSAIARLCRERGNYSMVSGSLYMICNIWVYAMTISELDDDLLGGVQRSWVLARLEAVRQYRKGVGDDNHHLSRLMISVYQDLKRATPVPEYLR